ncbi:hypothetical protein B0I33_109103 [Prauserella shujinwangii]|uniref:YCII-related domain-containing protein n=1 Tax=Prauserella shujinwangii TaxID=1453103 RepID=A0A2T0LQ62_9PSEU|nr:YciI family protein [Prauserella shujinwangii]PRX45440.1 hypothetical protein B0I33_109103 [Prauserella shujinwangii]
MKYLLQAFSNTEAWEATAADWTSTGEMPPEVAAACEFFENLQKELTESGELVLTEGLADPSHSKVVRKVGGDVVTSDGPFAESKEVVLSFSIVDCASYDRALEIAARITDFTGEPIEVRPVPDGSELPGA